MSHGPNIYVQVGHRTNLGNYNQEERTVGLSGIPHGADRAFIESMMDTAELAIDVIRNRLNEQAISPIMPAASPVNIKTKNSAVAPMVDLDHLMPQVCSDGCGSVVTTPGPCYECAHLRALEEVSAGMRCAFCLNAIERTDMAVTTGHGKERICAPCYKKMEEESWPSSPTRVPGGTDVETVPEAGKPADAPENSAGGSSATGSAESGVVNSAGQPSESNDAQISPDAGKSPDTFTNESTVVFSHEVIDQAVAAMEHAATDAYLTELAKETEDAHVEGCQCEECGWDPFADGAIDIPCPEGCRCGSCLNVGQACPRCGAPKKKLEIRWLQPDGTKICEACKGRPTVEHQAEPIRGHHYPPKGTSPMACHRCGQGDDIATTHCPGSVITAPQGSMIRDGRLDYFNGGWKLAGAPGDTHVYPGKNAIERTDESTTTVQTIELAPEPTRYAVNQPAEASEAGQGIDLQAGHPPTTQPVAPAPARVEIPETVEDALEVFGTPINLPPLEWTNRKISEVNRDGTGGGQMRALNTVLSENFYKGGDRHWASLAILHAAYGPLRATLGSLKELTEAEAHVCLSFFESADEDSKRILREAASMLKGQIPLLTGSPPKSALAEEDIEWEEVAP